MEGKKIIVILGIISMILLIFQSANAEDIKYTKGGYIACPYLSDLAKIEDMLEKNDHEAANKMMRKGKCFLTEPDTPVYMLDIEPGFDAGIAAGKEYNYAVKFRFRGSIGTFWMSHKAFSERLGIGAGEGSRQKSTREWFVLKSFLWIKAGKTTRQEIIQKYPNPRLRDESGGEYVYYGHQHADFKGWDEISFIFDGNVLEEIRVEKKKE